MFFESFKVRVSRRHGGWGRADRGWLGVDELLANLEKIEILKLNVYVC